MYGCGHFLIFLSKLLCISLKETKSHWQQDNLSWLSKKASLNQQHKTILSPAEDTLPELACLIVVGDHQLGSPAGSKVWHAAIQSQSRAFWNDQPNLYYSHRRMQPH